MYIDPPLLTSASALLGAMTGGGASLLGAIYTQRTQERLQRAANEIAKREGVYAEFVMSASNLLLKARIRDEIALGADEQRLVGLINRMRLFAPPEVIGGAEAVPSDRRHFFKAERRAATTRSRSAVREPRSRSLAGVQLALPGRSGQGAPRGAVRARSSFRRAECRIAVRDARPNWNIQRPKTQTLWSPPHAQRVEAADMSRSMALKATLMDLPRLLLRLALRLKRERPVRIEMLDARQLKPGARQEPGVAATHIERVAAITEGRPPQNSEIDVADSWRRSVTVHGVDPASNEQPRILTSRELRDAREPLVNLMILARDEIDHLYGIVQSANYVVLLCNERGIAIDHRGNNAQEDQFKFWGTWLGGLWNEEAEGTNGIGTCIVEQRPITVHRTQHLRARHISLSCSAAPIFDGEGKLKAVLDVSSINPELSEAAHALTGGLIASSARAVQERLFRETFRREWIIAAKATEGATEHFLLAVDRDQRIVGADRGARRLLALRNESIEHGISLRDLFKPNTNIFRNKYGGDISTSSVLMGTSDLWRMLVTSPEPAAARWRNSSLVRFHTRPRLSFPDDFQGPSSEPRGGLSPKALRRVKSYIDANLGNKCDLATLANEAGLSKFHFSRAFKQSLGIPPHAYILERRIERAHQLLIDTALSLSEIARVTGFADQSHLSRHMHRRLGVSPTALRRLS